MPSYMITQDTSTPITKMYFFFNIAYSDYMSNIHFGKNIECEHWYTKVRVRIALKAHTELVIKLYDTNVTHVHTCDTHMLLILTEFWLVHF